MGWGALGWNGDDGPNSFCAWSRLELGWAEVIEPEQLEEEMRLEDVGVQGMVYKVPLSNKQFFLAEYRTRASTYYDRHLPGAGLLIWHVGRALPAEDPDLPPQSLVVDLECADGRWADVGYPLGQQADSRKGGDNLDFWAHNAAYTQLHRGNTGDATDVFDGVEYRTFSATTNPSAHDHAGAKSITIEDIRFESGRARATVKVEPPVVEIALFAAPVAGNAPVLAGWEVEVGFALANSGGLKARDLRARLRSEDPLVEILKAEVPLQDLEIGAEALGISAGTEGFPILRFARDFAGKHTASFTLEIYWRDTLAASKTFELSGHASHHLSGFITDEAGQPIPGGIVLVRGTTSTIAGLKPRDQVKADKNGFYEMYLASGIYKLEVRPFEREELESRDLNLPVFADTRRDFVLPTLYEVSGTVYGPDGEALANVRGFFTALDEVHGQAFKTDGDGKYVVYLLRAVYSLWATPSSIDEDRRLEGRLLPVEMTGIRVDGDRLLDIHLPGGVRIGIEVVDAQRRSVGNLSFILRGTGSMGSSSIRVGAKGTGFAPVRPGLYTIEARGAVPVPYLLPPPFQVEVVGDTTLQVVLEEGFRVTGKLQNDAGEEVGDAGLLRFTALDHGLVYEASFSTRDGSYALGLARGRYQVRWQASGNAVTPSQDLGIVEIEEEAVLDLTARQGYAIQSTIRNPDGLSVSESQFSIWLGFYSLDGNGAKSVGFRKDSPTIAYLLPGAYNVSISFSENILPTQDLGKVTVDGDGELAFTLKNPERLEGRMVDRHGADLPHVYLQAYAIDGSVQGRHLVGADATFFMLLPSHTYRLVASVRRPDFSLVKWIADEIQVPAEHPVEIRPLSGVRLSGRIAGSRGEFAGSQIVLTRDPRELFTTAGGYVAQVPAAADGTYEVEVPAGDYALIAYPSGAGPGRVVPDMRLQMDTVTSPNGFCGHP
jgi:hypothetical protein